MYVTQEEERLGDAQRRPRFGFAGHVREAAVRRDGLALGVESEDLRASAATA